ncbi:MAG: RluA family pseudouridine synthase [Clostridia bacterium]
MEYIVDKENIGNRLDIYLSKINEQYTRSYIKTLNDEGKILVNGNVKKAGYSLKENDIVSIAKIEDKMPDIKAEDIDLDIIYEDKDIIIVNKKKGMVVHPANGNYTGTLVNSLMYSHATKLSSINGVIRPGIVHRIDKDTTGILVVAKNDIAHKSLSEQFKVHSITRKYIALVKGIIKEDKTDIQKPIGRNPKDRKKMAVTDKNSKDAMTHIEVLERFYSSNTTLVEAELKTGRTHQIRVHMAYIGHPLVGDLVYGKKDPKFKIEGQLLHAKVLGIIHPSTGKYMEFVKEIPQEFEDIIKKLKAKENNT